jgi:hypothetical protein
MVTKSSTAVFIKRALSTTAVALCIVVSLSIIAGCAASSTGTPTPVTSASPPAAASPGLSSPTPSPSGTSAGKFVPGVGGGDAMESIEEGGRSQNQLGRKGMQKIQQINTQHNQQVQEP